MIGDLFDSPWKILIVAAVLIVLFGAAKLPVAARSLGKSMRILKTEVKSLHEDDAAQRAQRQIDDLQRQLADLSGPAGGQSAAQRAQQQG